MSESQTKAGNQECFEKLEKLSISLFSLLSLLSLTLSRHAEQLLFSCLGSKGTVYSRKLQCFFGTSPVTLHVIELVPS